MIRQSDQIVEVGSKIGGDLMFLEAILELSIISYLNRGLRVAR